MSRVFGGCTSVSIVNATSGLCRASFVTECAGSRRRSSQSEWSSRKVPLNIGEVLLNLTAWDGSLGTGAVGRFVWLTCGGARGPDQDRRFARRGCRERNVPKLPVHTNRPCCRPLSAA